MSNFTPKRRSINEMAAMRQDGATLDVIGKYFCVSGEWIRQILKPLNIPKPAREIRQKGISRQYSHYKKIIQNLQIGDSFSVKKLVTRSVQSNFYTLGKRYGVKLEVLTVNESELKITRIS